jgi:protein O-GlcNAc transferase
MIDTSSKMKSDQLQLRNQNAGLPDLLSDAWQLLSRNQPADAIRICLNIIRVHPHHAETLHILGFSHWKIGQHEQALACFDRAITAQPHEPRHYNSMGVILNESGEYGRAAVYLRKALEIAPDHVDAHANLGLALFHQDKFEPAAQHFQKALAIIPNHGAALANLGLLRLVQGRYSDAVKAYQKALAVDPKRPSWLGNLAAAWMELGQFRKAAACYTDALKLAPQNIANCVGLGVALRALGDFNGSIKILKLALEAEPCNSDVIANLAVACQHTCQWETLSCLHAELDKTAGNRYAAGELPAEEPLFNIRRRSDLGLNLAVASAWSRHIEHRALKCAEVFNHDLHRGRRDRITIGYLSYDFRDHPVAQQLFPLFRRHDRNKFKILAFSMGPNDDSDYRRQVHNGCDAFFHLDTNNLKAASETIYDQHVDILIDLMGHTNHNRMGILALRPAPLQISYLGFLASTGASFMDYVIADEVVVPEEHAVSYSEKIIWMPYCYQFNHLETVQSGRVSSRKEWGLPEAAFVFCCFNQTYKIDAAVFSTWMQILNRVPESILWLYQDNSEAADHLRATAETQGIEQSRLIFAEKVPLADHLKRLELADMALDTTNYNGGATTSNALRAGLPVLTVLGRHWVSRMSASHLLSIGLPELVAQDLAEYRQKATDLATTSALLEATRNKLQQNLEKTPLFDAEQYVRYFEDGLAKAWRNHQLGLNKSHIRVPATVAPRRTL